MSRSPAHGLPRVLAESVKREEDSHGASRSATDGGFDDVELPVLHGHAGLGGGPGDRSLAPEPGRQGLGHQRWQPHQSALLHAQTDRYDERQAADRKSTRLNSSHV